MELTTADLLRLAHVAFAFWFVAGLLGRNLVMGRAAGAGSVESIQALTELAGRFDRLMVQPGSLLVLVAGLLAAWEIGWPVLGSLNGGEYDWLFVSLLVYVSIGPLVPLVFLPRGKLFDASLREALSLGEVTPRLRAALDDGLVRAAHVYESAAVAFVIFLMVTKPF